MVSESFDADLRIKECEAKDNEDNDQRKARLKKLTNEEIKKQLNDIEIKVRKDKITKNKSVDLAKEMPDILS